MDAAQEPSRSVKSLVAAFEVTAVKSVRLTTGILPAVAADVSPERQTRAPRHGVRSLASARESTLAISSGSIDTLNVHASAIKKEELSAIFKLATVSVSVVADDLSAVASTLSTTLAVPAPVDPFDMNDSDDSIQFVTPVDKHIIPHVRCATLVKIVERLTVFPIPDTQFATAMLLTHQSFTTSEQLLDLLIQRYLKLHPLHPKTDIRPRVCNILKLWASNFWRDFESAPTLKNTLLDFVKLTVIGKDKLTIGHQLLQIIAEKEEEHAPLLCKRQQIHVDVCFPYSSSMSVYNHEREFLRFKPKLIAENITLLNSKLFSSIPRHEFLDQRWGKADRLQNAIHLTRKIEFFNKLSALIVSTVVSSTDIKERTILLDQSIKLGTCLRKMNNFDSAFAVMSALSSAPITRLKKTWSNLPSKRIVRFEQFATELSPLHNYRAYRALIIALGEVSPVPVVPYLGVYLSDLTFVGDGNPNLIDGRLINVEKRMMMASIIHEIRRFQLGHFPFTGDVIVQTWTMEALEKARSEQENYTLSLGLERRKDIKS